MYRIGGMKEEVQTSRVPPSTKMVLIVIVVPKGLYIRRRRIFVFLLLLLPFHDSYSFILLLFQIFKIFSNHESILIFNILNIKR
jgi:hypothetical protein